MTHGYLNDILLLFSAAVAVVVICLRLKLPPILGYLAIGVMMGPYGLGLIANTEHTRDIAEFGVVFLLFTIGLEFSLSQMLRMKNVVLGLGGAQVLVTTAITALVGPRARAPSPSRRGPAAAAGARRGYGRGTPGRRSAR